MADRPRLYAESSLQDYRDRERQRDAQRTGVLGKQDGTIEVSGRDGFVYVRLDGDPRKTVMALNRNGIQLVADLPVAVKREWVEGAPKWVLDGRAMTPLYPTDPLANTVGTHASQHLRGDLGTGGFDPLEVYNRMLIQTRVQAQSTPDMTVYLTAGPYMVNGTWYLSGGGDSGAFSVPTDHRCDLVYIASDLSLTILEGTDGAAPATRPTVPTNAFPLAWVWLDSTVTAITETMIEDARLVGGQTFSITAVEHDVLSATHYDSDPAAVVEDDIIVGTYSPAVFSPVWSRLPKGDDGDVLTINSTTHHVAWVSPQSVYGTGHTVQEEGTPLTTRSNLNFTGAGVTATDDAGNDATVVTIPGGELGWFNVQDYGATGDGVTDDTTAIADAITALVAAGTGVLYFPAGVYSTTGGFTLSVPTYVLGDGAASYFDPDTEINAPTRILCSSQTANLFSVTAFGCSFRGLMLQNTHATPTAGAGITVSEGDYCVYEDLLIYHFYVCLDIADGAEWKIDKCVFLEPISYGVKVVHTDFSGDFGDWCISNCSFFSGDVDSDAAIRYESGGGGKITNCKINGWYNSPPVGTAFNYGIDLAVQETSSVTLISNCSIENCRTDGIHVTNLATKHWGGIVINGCEFGMYGATGQAISIVATADDDINHVVIGDCVFFANANPALAQAIQLTNLHHVRLGNNLYDAGYYTTLYTATTCTDVVELGTGTVTSVGLTMPSQYSVANSPVTGADTLAVTWQSQTANRVLAGPAAGGAAAPTFRALVAADISGIAPGSEWSVLTAEEIAWDDLRVAGTMTRVGATAPTLGAFGPSGSLKVLHFDNGQHDEVHFEVQMPHNWKEGTYIYPHVHWTPIDATAGNVVWELEYSWQNINGAFAAPSDLTSDATAAGGTAWVHKMTKLKDGSGNDYIDGAGQTASSMLVCRLHRNAGAGDDTLAADVAFLEFDIHYQVDGLGSDAESSKSADTRYGLVYADGDVIMTETLR